MTQHQRGCFFSRLVLGVMLLLMSSGVVWGQAHTSLSGVVTDPTGSVVVGATVILTDVRTGATRTATTNQDGAFEFPQLRPGIYRVRVEMQGFKSIVQDNLQLLVNTPTKLDLQFEEVGEIVETVEVTGEVIVNTSDASVGNSFSEVQVRELPLLTRNVVQLLSLQPGVNQSGQVLGAREDQNNVTLDGVDVNDQQNPGAFESVLPIPLDSVQEFRVTTVGVNADQGRSSGGQVALVTKSGTNEFHGAVYWFHRNTVTAANRWFNNANGIEREALIRNQFGVAVGGPIVKDRAFFFVTFEGRRDASGAAQTRAVPTEAMKRGILTFRTNDGAIRTLTPEELAMVDPLGIGASPAMLQLFGRYPVGNDPDLGLDRGLNFTGFRFNAPFSIDRKAYVARFDFNLTRDGRHSVYWRGTLADNNDDNKLAPFPGQPAESNVLNNSRGFSTTYTAAFRPTLVNTFTWGFTRQGIESTGRGGNVLFVRSLDQPDYSGVSPARPFGRKVPVHNIIDNLTYIRGNHTIQTGINFRFIRNDRFSFQDSFARFIINNGALFGLGSEIVDRINAFIQEKEGNPDLAIEGTSNQTPVIRASMALLGTISDVDFTVQFDKNGNPLPLGASQDREFAANEYEFYVQDSWRVRPNLTINWGIRYGYFEPPYETTGFQVSPTRDLDDFFFERYSNGLQGIPSNRNTMLTYDLNGKVNGKDSWYRPDWNDLAPRFSFAWSPNFKNGVLARLLGSEGKSVFRGGFAIVYDRLAGQLIVQFDRIGSIGVATDVGFPDTFDFETAPRFNGSFPALPEAPPGGFPNTPPVNFAVINSTLGINQNLRSPYSYTVNFSYAREVARDITVEIGYAGRFGRKLPAQLDISSPLIHLVDPASGQTWVDAAGIIRDLWNSGVRQPDIEANPGIVPTIPYAENMFPDLKDFFIPGSASANLAWVMQFIPESEGDILHFLDRTLCIAKFGCHTFFALQNSSMPTWFNAGFSTYHSMLLTVRKRFSQGLQFDFNYTWAHSTDNESTAVTNVAQFGGVILDAFNTKASRAPSDFDIRQQFNANFLWELPIGHHRPFLSDIPSWADYVLGGWQLSGIVRYQTGLPSDVGTGFNFATNYFLTGNGVPLGSVKTKVSINNDGNPGIFPDKDAARRNFRTQRAGETGPRNILRLDDFFNVDLGILKNIPMPWEGHRLQFRFEMFNAFNNVNFDGNSVSLQPFDVPARFGEFSDTFDPRVIQFALRYEF